MVHIFLEIIIPLLLMFKNNFFDFDYSKRSSKPTSINNTFITHITSTNVIDIAVTHIIFHETSQLLPNMTQSQRQTLSAKNKQIKTNKVRFLEGDMQDSNDTSFPLRSKRNKKKTLPPFVMMFENCLFCRQVGSGRERKE